ncbi:HD domain-containing protein [Achromobacter mucicolens]|uniref:HD domain-containing protein n=1 Tax=Achromobacter mucicolens TaxID=1389922 RepID=UPI0022F3D454|nr:HD domain-containing protein [Achromobacter mucicolens]WBX88491.1 HD domain-containing protein [Achromobacter mucicolens]
MAGKIIKDPIHGAIEFEGEAELYLKSMLSDLSFQRLRRVKQLGFADFVFPSATHSRFAHSLGVYAVTKRMLAVVEPQAQRGEWSQKGNACLAAALLHDIGHGMFSHAFENAIVRYMRRNKDGVSNTLAEACNHETTSLRIVKESSITQTLKDMGGNDFPAMVADIIAKKDEKCIYTSLISSQLDADRLDYAKRDSYFAGVSSGGIDLDWLMRNLRRKDGPNGCFLYVTSKAYIALEQFTVTLFQLYPTLYLHKRIRGVEYMFSLLLSRVFECISAGEEEKAGLTENHPLVLFFRNPENLSYALLLDDALFMGSLYLFQQADDELIKTTAERIILRKFYPMLDIWKFADELAAENSAMRGVSASRRVEVLNTVCERVAQHIQGQSVLWTETCSYDNYPRKIYKPLNVEGGHPQQINVEVGGKIVDIASISPIVASSARFSIHRIFHDDAEKGLGEKLRAEIRSKIQRELPVALETSE